MTSFCGSDVRILIGTDEYSNYIDEIKESGGQNNYAMVRTFGNNYEQVLVGESDIEVTMNFRVAGIQLKTLYESMTPAIIKCYVGSEMLITWSNVLPEKTDVSNPIDNISDGALVYKGPARTSGTYNRTMVTGVRLPD